jgi:hypothetical protein
MMVDFALGLFAIAITGSAAISGIAFIGLITMAVVEWVKYRRKIDE